MPATLPDQTPRLMNLGCGRRTHAAWINLDHEPAVKGVLNVDLEKGIPFPNDSFDAVYHSHVLEHFAKDEAPPFLRECRRVLKPGGILRVVVPDLEAIVRAYLQAVEEWTEADPRSHLNHAWMVIEFLDQVVRHRHGGEMSAYFREPDAPNLDFVMQRLGAGGEMIKRGARLPPRPQPGVWRRLLRIIADRRRRRDWLARVLLGSEYHSLQVGRFRLGGEPHLWMYDRCSLRQLLAEAGFCEITCIAADESRIPAWSSYCLDTEPDGRVYKPSSVYMEALKPADPEAALA